MRIPSIFVLISARFKRLSMKDRQTRLIVNPIALPYTTDKKLEFFRIHFRVYSNNVSSTKQERVVMSFVIFGIAPSFGYI